MVSRLSGRSSRAANSACAGDRFASENAIAHRQFQGHGLSAYAPEATAEQVAEVSDNVGPIHRLAIAADASVKLVETGITSGAIDVENGLSPELFGAAVSLGVDTADGEIDAGCDLLIPADLSVRNTTVAAAVMGVLNRTEPVSIVGPGSGTTDAMWKTKVAAIRDAMFRARNFATSPHELLQVIGNADLAAEAALIAQAATRRTRSADFRYVHRSCSFHRGAILPLVLKPGASLRISPLNPRTF